MSDEAPIVRYPVTAEAIERKRAEFADLSFDTSDGYKAGVKAIAECRGFRGAVETRRKLLKKSSLDWGRRVDSGAKTIVDLIEPMEALLKKKKAAVDDEKERIKREKKEAERKAVEEAQRREREAADAKRKAEQEAEDADREFKRKIAEKAMADRQAKLDVAAEAQRRERDELEAERAKLDEEKRKAEQERKALDAAKAEAAKPPAAPVESVPPLPPSTLEILADPVPEPEPKRKCPMGVDEKCIELAEHFLAETPHEGPRDVRSLAEAIQTAVEDWFEPLEDEVGRRA